jgi:hypothetical protein
MAPELSTETKSFIMDNKLISEFGTDILSYRIRTARQKKRMQHEDLEKRLLKLDKERWQLRVQQFNRGWAPVDPPYQRGWKRFFVLRADVARSNQAEFFEGILKKINTSQWSYRKDFRVRGKRNKKVLGKYRIREQHLLAPDPMSFAKLDFSDKEKLFFEERLSYCVQQGKYIKSYVFIEPWRFELRIRPNIVREAWIVDPVLKSRQKEIDSFIEKGWHEGKITKLNGGAWTSFFSKLYERRKYVYAWKHKSFSQLMDEIKKEWNDE